MNGIAAKQQNKKQTKGPGVSPTLRLNEGLFIHDIPTRKKKGKSYMQLKFSIPQKAMGTDKSPQKKKLAHFYDKMLPNNA